PLREDARDVLVRAVLEQPGEQQVPRLQQREVLVVLDAARGQQARGLEVEERRGDDEELARRPEVPPGVVLPCGPRRGRGALRLADVRDEVVRTAAAR